MELNFGWIALIFLLGGFFLSRVTILSLLLMWMKPEINEWTVSCLALLLAALLVTDVLLTIISLNSFKKCSVSQKPVS